MDSGEPPGFVDQASVSDFEIEKVIRRIYRDGQHSHYLMSWVRNPEGDVTNGTSACAGLGALSSAAAAAGAVSAPRDRLESWICCCCC